MLLRKEDKVKLVANTSAFKFIIYRNQIGIIKQASSDYTVRFSDGMSYFYNERQVKQVFSNTSKIWF